MHNGQYYFNKIPKQVQEDFKKAYEAYEDKKCIFEDYLNKKFDSNLNFIDAFTWGNTPQGGDYWYEIACTNYGELTDVCINSEPLYTASDLVKFGNYLLSPERKVTHEENRGVVTDADLEWINLNKE